MKMKRSNKKTLSLFLCIVLTVAMALFTTGCNGNTENGKQLENQTQEQVNENSSEKQEKEDNSKEQTSKNETELSESNETTEGLDIQTDITILGEGEKQFAFVVVDSEGNETIFAIQTDKETVGEALLELELISGEQGDYGLYVKTVNNITADYDKDKTYWAFYVNDEYAISGVDKTAIIEGTTYAFKVQK